MILRDLTLTSILWIIIGIGLLGAGGYSAYYWRVYTFSSGIFLLGLGSILCGLTNGFTDYSRTGRLMWRVGAISLLGGVLLIASGVFPYI